MIVSTPRDKLPTGDEGDAAVVEAKALKAVIWTAFLAAVHRDDPCPFCVARTSNVWPYCVHFAGICVIERLMGEGWRDVLDSVRTDLEDPTKVVAGGSRDRDRSSGETPSVGFDPTASAVGLGAGEAPVPAAVAYAAERDTPLDEGPDQTHSPLFPRPSEALDVCAFCAQATGHSRRCAITKFERENRMPEPSLSYCPVRQTRSSNHDPATCAACLQRSNEAERCPTAFLSDPPRPCALQKGHEGSCMYQTTPRADSARPPKDGYTLETDIRGNATVAIYAEGMLRHRCAHGPDHRSDSPRRENDMTPPVDFPCPSCAAQVKELSREVVRLRAETAVPGLAQRMHGRLERMAAELRYRATRVGEEETADSEAADQEAENLEHEATVVERCANVLVEMLRGGEAQPEEVKRGR